MTTTCQHCDHPLAAGHLCNHCRDQLAEHLVELPTLLDRLADLLIPTTPTDSGRRGPSSGSRPPLDLDMIGHRYGFALLPSWHRAILDGTGHHRAMRYSSLDDQVTGACIALRASIAWISRWPGAGDLAREVKELVEDTLSVVGPVARPIPMGHCPATHDGTTCGATLTLPPGQQIIHCPGCHATYPPGIWADLRRAQRHLTAVA